MLTIGLLLERTGDEAKILAKGLKHLALLVAIDDWLPDIYAQPDERYHRQYLLYRDPQARFSVISFVWGPGQATPIHDHTVWGLIGMLRGKEIAERFERRGGVFRLVGSDQLAPGDVASVSPAVGDIHRVSNAYSDRVSISVHVYGADIGAVERSIYDTSGTPTRFISSYADAPLPSLDISRSRAVRSTIRSGAASRQSC